MNEFGSYVAMAAIALAVMAIFSPTRALLGWLLGSNGPVMKLVSYVSRMTASLLSTIMKDHALILKNFAPRGVVIKTLDKSKS